jgi:hypothetical protein
VDYQPFLETMRSKNDKSEVLSAKAMAHAFYLNILLANEQKHLCTPRQVGKWLLSAYQAN